MLVSGRRGRNAAFVQRVTIANEAFTFLREIENGNLGAARCPPSRRQYGSSKALHGAESMPIEYSAGLVGRGAPFCRSEAPGAAVVDLAGIRYELRREIVPLGMVR